MPPRPTRTFARLLCTYRRRKGYTQAQLARATSVSQGYISALETGVRPPNGDLVVALSRSLDLSVEEMQQFLAAGNLPPLYALPLRTAPDQVTTALVTFLGSVLLIARDGNEAETILDDLRQRLDRWRKYRNLRDLALVRRTDPARQLYQQIVDAELDSPLGSRLHDAATRLFARSQPKWSRRVEPNAADPSPLPGRVEELLAEGSPTTHQIRNLLTLLVVYPEWIKMQLPVDHPLGVGCDAMLDAAEHMIALMEDLVMLASQGAWPDELCHSSANEHLAGAPVGGPEP